MTSVPSKIFFFDVDGVLIRHTTHGNSSWASTAYADCGIQPESLQDFFSTDFDACREGRADLKVVLKPWLAKWRYQGTVDDFIDYWFRSHAVIDGDMLEIAIQLSAVFPCFLATNQERLRAEYIMETLEFKNYFCGIFAAYELGCSKPKLDFFLSIQSKVRSKYHFNFKPSQFYFVDDSERNVKAALQLGWQAHHFTDFNNFISWTETTRK